MVLDTVRIFLAEIMLFAVGIKSIPVSGRNLADGHLIIITFICIPAINLISYVIND